MLAVYSAWRSQLTLATHINWPHEGLECNLCPFCVAVMAAKQCVCLSVCLSVCMYLHACACVSVFVFMSVSLSAFLRPLVQAPSEASTDVSQRFDLKGAFGVDLLLALYCS